MQQKTQGEVVNIQSLSSKAQDTVKDQFNGLAIENITLGQLAEQGVEPVIAHELVDRVLGSATAR